MTDVFIGLGSNLAEPEIQLKLACQHMAGIPESSFIACSSFYSSLPMGPHDQPSYLNAVVQLHTELSADALLIQTQAIEKKQGRQRKSERWGPRTLDLDILLFGQLSIQSERLTIPHYGMRQREFVLYPLYELVPELILPTGETLASLVEQCPKNGLQVVNA
jgi:2-amino-4-hydroxy-6-hydroxymethyldihydropteridine diphosphokinase